MVENKLITTRLKEFVFDSYRVVSKFDNIVMLRNSVKGEGYMINGKLAESFLMHIDKVEKTGSYKITFETYKTDNGKTFTIIGDILPQ